MVYEPLHHKYRPQTFGDLVGQDAIAKTLINAILSRRIAPAYLFTGPRGTGKTSSARILAKSLNCLSSEVPTPTPCGQCEVCRAIAVGSALDIIEIDAASNTGVDNIREIIERSQFAPVQCRYKVYVIDECHMLSTAAFNALLKTLEEPPDRVIFVLATTDPQRVLPTIISRCQRFDYRRIPLQDMVDHLSKIAHLEDIDIDPEAVTLVAQIANGGLRDAESLLDQLSLLSETITAEKVWELVGAVPERDLLTLLQAIHSNQSETILDQCRHLMNRGREPLVVLQNLASFYLNLLIAKTAPHRPDMVAVTAPTWQDLCTEALQWDLTEILRGQQRLKDSEIQLKNTTQPRLWLEVTLLGLLPQISVSNTISVPAVTPKTVTPVITSQPKPEAVPSIPQPKPEPVATPVQNIKPIEIEPEPITTSTSQDFNLEQIWQQVIQVVEPTANKSLFKGHCTLLSFNGSVADVSIVSDGLLKVVRQRVPSLEEAFIKVSHQPVKVNIHLASSTPKPPQKEKPSEPVNPVSAPQNNIVTIQPQPKIEKPSVVSVPKAVIETPSPNLSQPTETNISDPDLKSAAENFAKIFEGEIVIINSKITEDEDTENADSTTETTDKPFLAGRPTLNDISDDEDIPF
ncbi:DNA polymerase III subunit gamma/tau [Chroococcus sp. FPU101]|uniref:DNA polymerase III subunit gamma/tau n=1 Tax=Chroococcus sp. FPU101 TaxID=1974212 RepID=UPI001A8F330F|nr:DNA polymerase III subunit gamma/tau [Chroococcus sp. FPU101]GFE69381.1 DNA polymerase III gamma/tau subunit [Chroococcus sp. FPU101]